MHGESLGDFLILLELWTIANSVDTDVPVFQEMVACEPSLCDILTNFINNAR